MDVVDLRSELSTLNNSSVLLQHEGSGDSKDGLLRACGTCLTCIPAKPQQRRERVASFSGLTHSSGLGPASMHDSTPQKGSVRRTKRGVQLRWAIGLGATAGAGDAFAGLSLARAWGPACPARQGVTGLMSAWPSVRWPEEDEEHFFNFTRYGWEWQERWSVEENLMSLVRATGLNCIKFKGYIGGHCSAVLCRPIEDGLEVVGLGINVPMPQAFASNEESRRRAEVHAEMQILSRCARFGISTNGCWMCIQRFPCWECCKAMLAAGITRVVFECPNEVPNEMQGLRTWGRSMLAAQAAGLEWIPVRRDAARQAYVDQLWRNYKEAQGLNRGAVKELARDVSPGKGKRNCTPLLHLALHDATAAFLILRLLPPRTWWQLRALSKEWRQLLDDHAGCIEERPPSDLAGLDRECFGLVKLLVEAVGPLRTANEEVDFAGCVYRAVHFGSTGPLQQLLRPLAAESFARGAFARGVIREALVQAAVAGDAATCRAVLQQHGPKSQAAVSRRLRTDDAVMALKAAADWHLMSPDDVPELRRQAVDEVLKAVF
ncbi:unnamed protein product [Durusdinium trenchii]|uniref:CMP/dCMP-type deaminase domain-containing protein n=1 Tax=Durusdinium trenchii TaxID=1381693 RepID=A0ABP0QZR3_9DINO